MFFTQDTIDQLSREFRTIHNKQCRLIELYTGRLFENERAQEYANHGFIRRIYTLVRCIESVFSVAAPEREDLLTHNDRKDIEINLQAFITNVFGCLDNLAWVWVLEKTLLEKMEQFFQIYL